MLRLKTRRIVFWSMVVLYGFTATAILLFANGYRARLWPVRVASTGNILATFEPKNASFFLNGELHNGSSPVRERAVFPGTHSIQIEAPGYFSYNRSILVEARSTTFATNIFLVRNTDAVVISTSTQTTSTEAVVPPMTVDRIDNRTIVVSSTPSLGTVLVVNGTVATRDLGPGVHYIVGGDKNMIALLRADNLLEFREWKTLDDVAFTINAQNISMHDYDNGKYFVAHSPFELWLVKSDKKSAHLISRVSKPIKQVVIMSETMLALVLFRDEIAAYQLGEQRHEPQSIVSGGVFRELRIGSDDESIEYVSEEHGIETLYRREIF